MNIVFTQKPTVMLKNTNLFKHAPKELVLDAFLTWLLYFLNSDPKYRREKKIFFEALLLKPEDANKEVQNIKVEKQKEVNKGRVDIALTFRLDNDGDKEVFFENKTWAPASKKQLESYKNEDTERYEDIFLKLAYMNAYEKKIVKECGYKIIDVFQLSETLEKIKGIHFLIGHYLEFLNMRFKGFIDRHLKIDHINKKTRQLLKFSQVQQYIIDQIYNKLDGKNENLKIKVGSSAGRPWTQLDICRRDNTYGSVAEYVFWRLDKRSGKYYIRLNQYADVSNSSEMDKDKKEERLDRLQKVAEKLSKKYDMKLGELSNRGIYEREIIILFMEDQKCLKRLLDDLVLFSLDFCMEYKKI